MSAIKKKKKKKHRNRLQYERHLRELAGRKKFLKSMQRIFDALDLPNLFLQLPKNEREKIIRVRFRPLRLHIEEGVKVSRKKLDMLRFFISIFSYTSMMPVLPGYGEVTVRDFFTAGLTLFGYTLSNLDLADTGENDVISKMLPFATLFIEDKDFWWHDKLLTIAGICGNWVSRVNEAIYHVDPESYCEEGIVRPILACTLKLYRVPAQHRNIMIDGKNRPAYRVGWAYPKAGVIWASITAQELGKKHPFAQLPMEVYIQSHAIIRMRERLDTFHPFHLNTLLCSVSVGEKEVVPLSSGRVLVACYEQKVKLGYFLTEIIEGVVVIRTFLFITNSGTPEGDRLNRELKIGKSEKKLFALDRLSSFVGSDYMKDKKIRDIFTRAHLGHLCDLDPLQFVTRDKISMSGYSEDFLRSLQEQPAGNGR